MVRETGDRVKEEIGTNWCRSCPFACSGSEGGGCVNPDSRGERGFGDQSGPFVVMV